MNWDRINHDRWLITKAGYRVHEEKPWHFEVTKDGSVGLVHVWPTTCKYMAAFDVGGSTRYFSDDELLDALARIFTPLKAVEGPTAYEAAKGARDLFSDIKI